MGKVIMSGKVPKLTVPINLPSGYTKLEYIQSSGTQYIDTRLTGEFTLVADIEFVSTGARNLMGYSAKAGCYFGVDADGYYELGGSIVSTLSGLVRRTITVHSTDADITLTADGESITREKSAVPTENFLFLGGLSGYPCSAKSYGAHVFDSSGVLVLDFVPCVSDTDGVGLFDLVNQEFYGNAGTGSFVGSEVV